MQLFKWFLFYCHLSKRAERGEEWLGYLPSDDVQREKEITCRNEGVLKFTSDTLRRRRPVPPPSPPPSSFVYRPVVRPKRRDDASRVIETSFSFFLLFLQFFLVVRQFFFFFSYGADNPLARHPTAAFTTGPTHQYHLLIPPLSVGSSNMILFF